MKIKIDSEFLIGIASFLKRLRQTTTMWDSECSECHKQFGRDGRYNFTKCPTCIGYEITSIVDKQNKARSKTVSPIEYPLDRESIPSCVCGQVDGPVTNTLIVKKEPGGIQPKRESCGIQVEDLEYVMLQPGHPRTTDNGPHQAGTYIQDPIKCYHIPPCEDHEQHALKKLIDLED